MEIETAEQYRQRVNGPGDRHFLLLPAFLFVFIAGVSIGWYSTPPPERPWNLSSTVLMFVFLVITGVMTIASTLLPSTRLEEITALEAKLAELRSEKS